MEGNATKPISQSFDCPKPLSLSLYTCHKAREVGTGGTGRETTSFASYISCHFFWRGIFINKRCNCLLPSLFHSVFCYIFFFAFSALSLLCAIIKWFCGLLLTNLLDFHLHRVRPMAANLAIQLSVELCEVFCGRLERDFPTIPCISAIIN